MFQNLTMQASTCYLWCVCVQVLLVPQNKFFQINISNAVSSLKNSHCNFDWNCVKCQDPLGENWPLGHVRSSFCELQWVPSVPAESGAHPWTADRWLLAEKETRGRQEMVNPLPLGPSSQHVLPYKPKQLWARLPASPHLCRKQRVISANTE